jgi:hypothetical protein
VTKRVPLGVGACGKRFARRLRRSIIFPFIAIEENGMFGIYVQVNTNGKNRVIDSLSSSSSFSSSICLAISFEDEGDDENEINWLV